MNHAIAFYHSENWDGLALFAKRAKKFLIKSEDEIEKEYCLQAKKCLSLFEAFILLHCDSQTTRQIYEEL